MTRKATRSEPPVRPYYVPESVDFAALPEPVKLLFATIIEPTYKELVLGAGSALVRSAGVTLTFLLSLELLEQFEMGHLLNFAADPNAGGGAERDRLIARYLRIVGAKQNAEKFLLRLHQLRAEHDLANIVRRGQ